MANFQYNLNTNHPLIPNSNEYYLEKKFVSIHSEDRNVFRYPNASEFEIELPQDYLNVQSVRLVSWSFPANYNVFSSFFSNLVMTFKITEPYNPGENSYSDPLSDAIFAGLYYNKDFEYRFSIQPGFYNPLQMVTELTNKFNEIVTLLLQKFFQSTPAYNYALALFNDGYTRFKIIYDDVGQKIWFGNTADQFLLNNDSQLYLQQQVITNCSNRNVLPSYNTWGLPAYLGFTKCPVLSTPSPEGKVPRFYYATPAENNGFWLVPTLPGANVYFIEAPLKINFMGPAYIYMEIPGLNCIDETSPWSPSNFSNKTNESYGVVNSAFAKIPVPSTPISQWFDQEMPPYKYFYPPAERIRKLSIKLRYHDGQTVDFGTFDYSFMLEVTLLRPFGERKFNIRDSSSLAKLS
jgi:hypothetical protein